MGLVDEPGEVALRVYDNVACNPTRLNVSLVGATTDEGLGESGCYRVGQAAGMAGGVVRYARASCTRMTTTMTSTATSTPTTELYVKTQESLSVPAVAMIGVSVAMLFCWICIICVCLRYRNRQDENEFTGGGLDPLEFGAPQPMQAGGVMQLDGFETGGEIDPITGEVMIYGQGGGGGMAETSFSGMDFGQGTVRLPGNASSGVRANPLFSSGMSGASSDGGGDYLAMGTSEIDELERLEGADSIGSLSDFDEADFEDFADSLIADSALSDLPVLSPVLGAAGVQQRSMMMVGGGGGGVGGGGGNYTMGEINYNTNIQQRINIGRNSIDFDLDTIEYGRSGGNDLEFENVGLALTQNASSSRTRNINTNTAFENARSGSSLEFDLDNMEFQNQDMLGAQSTTQTTRKVRFAAGGDTQPAEVDFSANGGINDESTYGELSYSYIDQVNSDDDDSLDLDNLGGEVVVANVEYGTIGDRNDANTLAF